MGKPLRILMVEDSEDDAQLTIHALKNAGCDPVYERVETAQAMRETLAKGSWDIILCDYLLPQFNGLAAIALLKEIGTDIPLIIVSGAIGEETAVECMRLGANDYVMKDNLARLTPAIARELQEAASRRQRKEADKALSRSQKLLAETGKMGKVGGWEFNIDTGKQLWTEEVYRIHEVDLTYDPTLEKGVSFYTPASRPIIERAVQQAIEHGTPFDMELEIITAKGDLRQVHAIGKADPGGRRVHGFFQDITERKILDLRLKLAKEILETLNRPNNIIKLIEDILFLLKEHTGFEAIGIRLKEGEDYPYFVSTGFPTHFIEAENHLCAFDAAGEIIRDTQGKAVLECMCGNILCERTDTSLPFFTAGGSFWSNGTSELLATTSEADRQARTRNRCNSEGYESVALIPLRSGAEIIGLLQMNDSRQNIFTLDMIVFFEEIGTSIGIAVARRRSADSLMKSEQDLLNSLRQLQEAKNMLVQSEKLAAIGTLAAGVTHEILNPLNIISLYLQMLDQAEIPPEKIIHVIEVCQKQVERIAKISKDLNQFARQGSQEIVMGDINYLLEQTINLITPKLRVNQVAVDVQLESDLPSIPLDRNRLGQVFLNLVNNAVDAMEGVPEKVLQVSTELVISGEKEFVRVVFADRGTGIPEEAIRKIFDPFFTTKEQGKGTGLGLSITYGIIQDHGGKIWAGNNACGGASFSIELPVQTPSATASSCQGSTS